MRLPCETARHRVTMATTRLPAFLDLAQKLSISLWDDEVKISFQAISQTLCVVFGYDSLEDLLNDTSFNADNLSSVEYLTYDPKEITEKFSGILDSENIENIEADHLLEYIESEIEIYEIKLLDEASLPEIIHEEIQVNEILVMDEGLSGAIAETNAYFEEEPELSIDTYGYNDERSAFELELSGSCSGSQHEDKMFYGDTIGVGVVARLPVILGKNALSEYELDVSGSVIHPDPEE